MQQNVTINVRSGRKNEWIITGKKESLPIFDLTWSNPESLVTGIGFYRYWKLSMNIRASAGKRNKLTDFSIEWFIGFY